MGLGRPKAALILTDEEHMRLDSLAHRSRTAPHLARRARIILLCASGHDNKVVAKRLRMSQVTVCKWRQRFVRERLDGVYDEPRPGAPRRITDEQIEQVIVRTLETTPAGATHWSTRGMAKASGLGRTAVGQIWQAFGLQPHRAETFKLSKDSAVDAAVPKKLDMHLIIDNDGTHKTAVHSPRPTARGSIWSSAGSRN
jgi:transposase